MYASASTVVQPIQEAADEKQSQARYTAPSEPSMSVHRSERISNARKNMLAAAKSMSLEPIHSWKWQVVDNREASVAHAVERNTSVDVDDLSNAGQRYQP